MYRKRFATMLPTHLLVLLSSVGAASTAQADTSLFSLDGDNAEIVLPPPPTENPFSFSLQYSVVSDYVFRGINFSEFEGEGRERLNHQLNVQAGVDLGLAFGGEAGSLGTVYGSAWFEWFAAQDQLDPEDGGQNLQEVDYSVWWAYNIEPIATNVNIGYIFYTYPNNKPGNSQEFWFKLQHNDAWMWKWLWPENEKGILNPSFYYATDTRLFDDVRWMEIGISHPFQIGDALTITPGITWALDHRYLDAALATEEEGSRGLAYVQYGLNVGLNLNQVFDIPDQAGNWNLGGFMYYNDPKNHAKDEALIDDEFVGGVSISVSF